jgi:hypothetical protein
VKTDVVGGWMQGKPVTTTMRELLEDARDKEVYVADESPAYYASLILERWGWLTVQRQQNRSLRVGLTDSGREALSGGE